MKLNEKIIALRNKYQMSQGDLAEKLNVSRQSVSKWETGASIPDLDRLIAMSELFHVTMDELVKDGVEIGCEVAEQKDEMSNENDDEMCNNACDIVVKHEKRIFRIVIGVVLSLWSAY